jgi:hypothetical protein
MNFREELSDISYRIVISSRTVYLFPFVISHFEVKVRNQEYRKKHCIATPLVAQKIGKQTYHGLPRDTQETEDFFSKGMGLSPFHSMWIPYSEDSL